MLEQHLNSKAYPRGFNPTKFYYHVLLWLVLSYVRLDPLTNNMNIPIISFSFL